MFIDVYSISCFVDAACDWQTAGDMIFATLVCLCHIDCRLQGSLWKHQSCKITMVLGLGVRLRNDMFAWLGVPWGIIRFYVWDLRCCMERDQLPTRLSETISLAPKWLKRRQATLLNCIARWCGLKLEKHWSGCRTTGPCTMSSCLFWAFLLWNI